MIFTSQDERLGRTAFSLVGLHHVVLRLNFAGAIDVKKIIFKSCTENQKLRKNTTEFVKCTGNSLEKLA